MSFDAERMRKALEKGKASKRKRRVMNRTKREIEDATSDAPKKNEERPVGASDCPRWMYHRKGVFCKTCGRTP